MSADQLHALLLCVYAFGAVLVFVVLQFVINAAYGRHNSPDLAWWWGPGVPTRFAWIVMELPACLGFAIFYFVGEHALELAPLILFLLWQMHYFQRSFIYPFLRRIRPGDRTPLLIPALALITNSGIAFLNASILSWASIGSEYTTSWLLDPRFILGCTIFALGYYVNRKADSLLAALRKPGDTGYKVPRGWLYEKISCPNYLGELIIWVGWAIATWSAAGAIFALWTAANLLPRALAHHQWYRQQFPDYPPERKALIPGLI